MLDVELNILNLISKIAISITTLLIVFTLSAPAIEPIYYLMARLFRWEVKESPEKESLIFLVKLLAVSVIVFFVTRPQTLQTIVYYLYRLG